MGPGLPYHSFFILLVIFFMNMVARMILAPLLPVLEPEFGMTHGEAGALFLFIAAGHCTGLLVSPFVSSRLSHRRTLILSTLALGAALLALSRAPSPCSMMFALLLVGLSAGFYLPSGVATLTGLVPRQGWGKALAMHEIPPNLALVSIPFVAEGLLRLTSWRGILTVVGLAALLVGSLYHVWGPKAIERAAPPTRRNMGQVLRLKAFWVMAAIAAFSVGAESGVYAMLPLFLVTEMGAARGAANSLIGSSRLAGLLALFGSGVIADRLGHVRAAVIFLGVVGLLTFLLGTVRGPVVTRVFIVLQAASLPCFFPACLAVLSRIFPLHLRGVGISFVMLAGVLFGSGLIPPGIGYLAENASFSVGFALLGVSLLFMVPFATHLRHWIVEGEQAEKKAP